MPGATRVLTFTPGDRLVIVAGISAAIVKWRHDDGQTPKECVTEMRRILGECDSHQPAHVNCSIAMSRTSVACFHLAGEACQSFDSSGIVTLAPIMHEFANRIEQAFMLPDQLVNVSLAGTSDVQTI